MCEKRLQSFFDSLTKNRDDQKDNLNFKSNALENIFKARNFKVCFEAWSKRAHGDLSSIRKVYPF